MADDHDMKIAGAPDGDGLVLTFELDGKRISAQFTVPQLRDIIRQTYARWDRAIPSDDLGHATLELVHAGQSQESRTVTSQLLLYTVQIEAMTLSSDEIGLRNLRDQIDQILALRGGHQTKQ